MTRKDFELIAQTLRLTLNAYGHNLTEQGRVAIVTTWADVLETTNFRFDRERFIEAVGV